MNNIVIEHDKTCIELNTDLFPWLSYVLTSRPAKIALCSNKTLLHVITYFQIQTEAKPCHAHIPHLGPNFFISCSFEQKTVYAFMLVLRPLFDMMSAAEIQFCKK